MKNVAMGMVKEFQKNSMEKVLSLRIQMSKGRQRRVDSEAEMEIVKAGSIIEVIGSKLKIYGRKNFHSRTLKSLWTSTANFDKVERGAAKYLQSRIVLHL